MTSPRAEDSIHIGIIYKLLLAILIMVAMLGLISVIGGIFLSNNRVMASTTFNLRGNKFSSTSVGISAVCVGLIFCYFTFQHVTALLIRLLGQNKSDNPSIVDSKSMDSGDSCVSKKAIGIFESLGLQPLMYRISSELEAKFYPCEKRSDAIWTDADEAGLALVSAIIYEFADTEIRVIGRGPQSVDLKIRDYLISVVHSIQNHTLYNRILIIDDSLPENALLWLFFLERFLCDIRYSRKVQLRMMEFGQTYNILQQFQMVYSKNNTFLHVANRIYEKNKVGVFHNAISTFYGSGAVEWVQYEKIFNRHAESAGPVVNHAGVIANVNSILNLLMVNSLQTRIQPDAVLKIMAFVDELLCSVCGRGYLVIGALMPTTYTHDAVLKYAKTAELVNRINRKLIIMPFDNFEILAKAFKSRYIDCICIPLHNTNVGNLLPPGMTPADRDEITSKEEVGREVLSIHFVLACQDINIKHHILACAKPAFEEVFEKCPDLRKLPLIENEKSNLHAAFSAHQNNQVIAITTNAAAQHFGLQIIQSINTDSITTFGIYSHKQL